MISVTLDAGRIRRLCGELGIAQRELGACIGASGGRIHALLSGETAEYLSLLELTKLGDRLGIDGLELVLRQRPISRCDPTDAVHLHALLARAEGPLTRRDIAEILRWDLRRVRAALTGLDALLQTTGEVVHRSGTATVRLRPRDSCLSADERSRADRHTVRRGKLDRPAAQLLLRLVDAKGELSSREAAARTASGRLLKQGLAEVGPQGQLRLHEDVAFSLGLGEAL